MLVPAFLQPATLEQNIRKLLAKKKGHAVLLTLNLSGVDLTSADLQCADTTGADTTGADTTGADEHGAIFVNANAWCPPRYPYRNNSDPCPLAKGGKKKTKKKKTNKKYKKNTRKK